MISYHIHRHCVYVYTQVQVRLLIRVHVCAYVRVLACRFASICVNVCTCMYVHVRACTTHSPVDILRSTVYSTDPALQENIIMFNQNQCVGSAVLVHGIEHALAVLCNLSIIIHKQMPQKTCKHLTYVHIYTYTHIHTYIHTHLHKQNTHIITITHTHTHTLSHTHKITHTCPPCSACPLLCCDLTNRNNKQ